MTDCVSTICVWESQGSFQKKQGGKMLSLSYKHHLFHNLSAEEQYPQNNVKKIAMLYFTTTELNHHM